MCLLKDDTYENNKNTKHRIIFNSAKNRQLSLLEEKRAKLLENKLKKRRNFK